MSAEYPQDTTPAASPQAPDVRRINRLLGAAVTYRAAVDAQMLAAGELGAYADFRSAIAAQDAAAAEVLSAAEDVRSPNRLTSTEQALIDAALDYATTRGAGNATRPIDALLAAARRLAEEK